MASTPLVRSRGFVVHPATHARFDGWPAWSVWCIRVRPGHRGRGISHVLFAATTEATSAGFPRVVMRREV
jgi:GNAT superfamily N-acetyltransferase